MGDFLKYKSFLSSVEYSVDDNCLFGKVMFIKSLLTYEGETLQELEKNISSNYRQLFSRLPGRRDQAECSMLRRLCGAKSGTF